MKTLGKGIVSNIDIAGRISASVSAFSWISIATLIGAPISTTHSITGAIVGVGLSYMFLGLQETIINYRIIRDIVISWMISPVASMILAVPMYRAVRNLGIDHNSKTLKLLLLGFAAYSFGANDVANATGVYVTVTSSNFGIPDEDSMRFLALLASVFIALGSLTLGYKVVTTLAYKVTKLDLNMALAAGFANAFTIWVFTTIPYMFFGYGLPISTTYVAAGSIIGVGVARSG